MPERWPVRLSLLWIFAASMVVATVLALCGFLNEEVIAQFWAVNSIQAATDWLGYGAVLFGAIAVALSAVVLATHELPAVWRWISVTAAVLLVLSVLFHELSDTPAGDLAAAVASGVLLPVWAVILAIRYDDLVAVADVPATPQLEATA